MERGTSGVFLLDAATRNLLAEQAFLVPEGLVYRIAFSPDGKTLAAATSGGARIVEYGNSAAAD